MKSISNVVIFKSISGAIATTPIRRRAATQSNTAASLHTGAQRGALVGLSELGALRQAGVARTLEKRDLVFFLYLYYVIYRDVAGT